MGDTSVGIEMEKMQDSSRTDENEETPQGGQNEGEERRSLLNNPTPNNTASNENSVNSMELTLEECNKRSSRERINENQLVFRFNYEKTPAPASAQAQAPEKGPEECITWDNLLELRNRNDWEVIKHPYILHYLNECLQCYTIIYIFHFILYILFLAIFLWHIFQKTVLNDWTIAILTGFLIALWFFDILSIATKREIFPQCSFWSVLMLFIKIFSYVGSLVHILLPNFDWFNDFPPFLKDFILWTLPILVIFFIWIAYLEILQKSCVGIYVFMLRKIIRSFVGIAFIWVPTLFAFSFLFQRLMRNSGKDLWINTDNNCTNSINETDITNNINSDNSTLDIIFKAMIKTSSMMIGELDANNILTSQYWALPSFLLLLFEVVGAILLLNLMVSVAVGDVDELRKTSEEKLLKKKLDFVIIVLILLKKPLFKKIYNFVKTRTNNKLVINKDGEFHSEYGKFEPGNEPRSETSTNSGSNDGNNSSTSSVQFISTQSHDIIIINLNRDQGSVSPENNRKLLYNKFAAHLLKLEKTESGIPEYDPKNKTNAGSEVQQNQNVAGGEAQAMLNDGKKVQGESTVQTNCIQGLLEIIKSLYFTIGQFIIGIDMKPLWDRYHQIQIN